MTKDEIEKIKFLSDLPLAADEEQKVRFGHIDIAENLKQIILNCPTPFTIGLFAKWGTGKTTIINLLRESLKQESKFIAVANVDTWKYEGDSLRRQFLITLDEELNLGLNYKDKLNQTLTESDPTKGPIKFDWGILLNVYGLITCFLVVAGLILRYFDIPKIVSDSLFGFGVLGFLIQFTAGLFKRVSMTITEHRTDSAEGFERKFKNDILNHKEIKKKKKLLVIIDNLDRCSDAKAVELLSTIKTFLAKDTDQRSKCAFLIACDDMAIGKHLKSVYGNAIDTSEFLRKFFNTFQRIPDFIDTELQTYTEDLLKGTRLPQFDSPDVTAVITSAFRKNPRQIKQFINILITHFLLAQERENSDNPLIVPKGAVTGNVDFLAKFLLIYQQFPDIYDIIIENHLSSSADIENFDFEEHQVTKNQVERFEAFEAFLRATPWIRTNNIRPFHYFKQSEEELNIPEIDELKIALLENKEEVAKEHVAKLDLKQMESFEKVVISLIDKNKTNRIYLENITSSCLIALQHGKKSLTSRFYNQIAGLLNDGELLGAGLQKFEPSLIFKEVLTKCNLNDRDGIIDRYINIFSKPKEGKETK